MVARSKNVDDFLNAQPFGGYQWMILVFCFLIVALDGLSTGVMGFVAPAILKDWHITKVAITPAVSAALFGLAAGALMAGPLADRIGRKKVIVGSVLLFGTFCLLSATAQSVWPLSIFRFVTGIGLGAAMPNAVTLMSELSPPRKRMFFSTLMFCGFTLGSSIAGFVSAALIPAAGWRSVFLLIGGLSVLLTPLLIAFVPESVRFLIHKGAEPSRITAILSRVGPVEPGEVFTVPDMPHGKSGSSIAGLFSGDRAVGTILLWITYFMGLLVVYLLTNWLPTLMQQSGVALSLASLVTAMFMFGSTIGTVILGYLMDTKGRYRLLSTGFVVAAIFIILIAFYHQDVTLLFVLVFGAGFGMGAVTSMAPVAAEFYDTRCRATGVAWMLGVGRFGGIFGASIGGVLLTLGWDFRWVFVALTVPTLSAAIAMGAAGLYYARSTTAVRVPVDVL
jgi:AAHS family 4-hydroxybenzoate transporter-like MFS transporter